MSFNVFFCALLRSESSYTVTCYTVELVDIKKLTTHVITLYNQLITCSL